MSSANRLIERMPDAFAPELAWGLKMTVQFMIERPMYVIIDNGLCEVAPGQVEAPDATLTLSDDDLIAFMTGGIDDINAFMAGRCLVDGDILSARKLPSVFDPQRLR